MNDNPVSYKLLADAQHNSFVVNSYLRSHRYDYPYNQMQPLLYETEAYKFIHKLLSHSLVMLTYLNDQPDVYISFVIYQYIDEQLVLHYAYTKNNFRQQGLMKDTIDLILPFPNSPIVITHFPKYNRIMQNFQKSFPHSVFDPFYFMRPMYV